MRRFILITLAAAILFPSQMTGKGFRWGLEWGASGICHSNAYCVYTADEGFIVEYRKISNRLHVNGTLEGFVGIDFAQRLNISLHSGYAGIADGERGVPLSLRPTLRLGRNPDGGRASLFAEGGVFFRKNADISMFAKLGTGWRTTLSQHLALDFNAGLQVSRTHPDIYDKYSGRYLAGDSVRGLKCFNAGFFLTTALVF